MFSPQEARIHKTKILPKEVIDAVNHFLAKKIDGKNSFIIKQGELIEDILSRMNEGLPAGEGDVRVTSADIFGNHWLDFEDALRAEGWSVVYDKPSFDENRDAFWRITPKE